MKQSYSIEVTDEDGNEPVLHAIHGHDYYCALTDFKEYLRNLLKHEDLSLVKSPDAMAETIQTRFFEICEENSIDFNL